MGMQGWEVELEERRMAKEKREARERRAAPRPEAEVPSGTAMEGHLGIVMWDRDRLEVRVQDGEQVVLHRVGYTFRASLVVGEDGEVRAESYQSTYVQRADWITTFKEPTFKARKAIEALAIEAATAWLAANPDAPRLARVAKLRGDAGRLETQIATKRAEIAALEGEMDALDAERTRLLSAPWPSAQPTMSAGEVQAWLRGLGEPRKPARADGR